MAIFVAKTGKRFLAADRVWVAVALLQREHLKQKAFSLQEICERARQEGFLEESANTFYVHANQHCVANRMPNPGNYRMLFETEDGKRRLFKAGDPSSPGRTGKMMPNSEDIPSKYHSLIQWFKDRNKSSSPPLRRFDPLLRLKGSGRDLWKDEHADEYVRRLREGWE